MKLLPEELDAIRKRQIAGLASYLKNYWHLGDISDYAPDLMERFGSPFHAYQDGEISLGKLTELIATSLYDMGWRNYPEMRPRKELDELFGIKEGG